MLEFIVFVSGGALLVLEIVASRLLAPFFGNSVYVWGSLIGVFLAGLALGYFVGGRLADRRPSGAVFAALVFLAGVLTFPIPFMATPVMQAIALRDYGPQANPLAASLALFFLPTVVFGTISPFAVRLRARTVTTVGNVAGVLYALSTVGSIVGTLLAAFVLINLIGVRAIISGVGLAMILLSGAGLLYARRRYAAAVVGVLVALSSWAAASAMPGADASVIFQQDTVYHRITVSDEGPVRYLKLDNYWQSAVDLERPQRTVFAYSDYMHLPLIFVPEARRVALVGLGGGTVPRVYMEDYPSVEMDVAEIDPKVVEAARRLFRVPETPRLRISAGDGRLFLLRSPARFDAILLDAYLIDTIPFHLATEEFFRLAASRLAPGGVLASNVIGALEGEDSGLFRAIYKTFRAVFPTVYVFPVGYSAFSTTELLRNIIVVGSMDPFLSAEEVQARAARLAATMVRLPGFRDAAGTLYLEPIRTADVPVLTDDFAPVDALIPR